MLSSLEKDPRFQHLYQHNTLFRELTDQHRELRREADKLQKAIFLGPELENRVHELKKKKLGIKDRLEAMMAANS